MAETYEWSCDCGATGRGEVAAQRHAAECSRFGWPWTNPAWPRPDGDARMSAESCLGCDNPVDRTLPDPIPDGHECMGSEALAGRALYCAACYEEQP